MGTEIATAAQTASLTLAPNSEAATLLANVSDERELTPEQFALVARIAEGPPPALPTVTEEDVRKLIGTMAGTLKAARTSVDEGRLKLAVYKRMLGHLPLAALQHATHRALATLEWMPTPAELLKLADTFTAPERRAHERAKAMTFNRKQRLFEETLRNIRDRKLLPDELAALDDHTAKVAETQGSLIIRVDGSRQYRTKETVHAHLADLDEMAASMRDERDKRADESLDGDILGVDVPYSAKSDGGGPNHLNCDERAVRASVGDVASGLMAGMEVSDGD